MWFSAIAITGSNSPNSCVLDSEAGQGDEITSVYYYLNSITSHTLVAVAMCLA